MKLQTKCTWVIIGLLILEILPVPLTSIYCLYAVRKRPIWIPRVTRDLYTESSLEKNLITKQLAPAVADPMLVRKNSTIGLSILFTLDLLVPVIVPTILYIVRFRPNWFKSLIERLYADLFSHAKLPDDNADQEYPSKLTLQQIEQRFAELENKNFHFVKKQARKKLG